MTRGRFAILAVFGWLALPATALAQTTPAPAYPAPSNDQSIKIGAVIFYDYTAVTKPEAKDADGNTITPSSFDVKRAYLNVTGNISPVVSFRITPDVFRETGTDSSLSGSVTFRLKYGYAQFNLDQWTGKWTNTFVRLGIQQTPFVQYEEDIYRYRFQGQVFIEREGTFQTVAPNANTSADAGAAFHTDFPNNYGDVHVGIYNGEGYQRLDPNDQKSFQVRGTLRPLAAGGTVAQGLRVTAFYNGDHYQKNAPRTRFVTNLTFEHAHFNLGVDYLRMTDETSVNASKITGNGWSTFITPFLKEKGNGIEGLVRVDRFTPDDRFGNQERQRTIAGIAYWFPHPGGSATAALMLDFEELKFAGFPSNIPRYATQQRLAIHGLISF